jgi:hypothetical protein
MTRASDTARLLGAGATILDGTTISTADNDPQLILTSTDADGDKGPVVQFTRDSGSPADNDTLGRVQFLFDNDAAEVTTAVQIEAQVTDVSNGSEDASLNIVTMQAGDTSSRMKVNSSETVFNDDSKDTDFRVESNDKEGMIYVDAGNNRVAIGSTVPPAQSLTVVGASGANIGSLENGILALTTGTGVIGDTRMLFGVVDDNYGWIQTGDYGVAYRTLILNPTGGNVLVGTTNQSPAEGTGNGVRIGNNGTSQFSSNGDAGLTSNRTGDNGNVMTFRRDGTLVGTISVTGSSTAFNTSSDYRLKENVTYDFDATARLKQLKPCRFNFIADKDTTVDGFIAHEVSDIIPEAVIGKKDAMTKEVLYVDDDEIPDGKKIGDVKEASKIDAQGIDQSKIVPLLVKTIQELEARITTLENA